MSDPMSWPVPGLPNKGENKMSIQHFFTSRKVHMSDGSDLWELVTPEGERVATATKESTLLDLEIFLNLGLTDASDADSDIEINC